jgi:hypothetical protein
MYHQGEAEKADECAIRPLVRPVVENACFQRTCLECTIRIRPEGDKTIWEVRHAGEVVSRFVLETTPETWRLQVGGFYVFKNNGCRAMPTCLGSF